MKKGMDYCSSVYGNNHSFFYKNICFYQKLNDFIIFLFDNYSGINSKMRKVIFIIFLSKTTTFSLSLVTFE